MSIGTVIAQPITPAAYPKDIIKTIIFRAKNTEDEAYLSNSDKDFESDLIYGFEDVSIDIVSIDGVPIGVI